MEKALIHVVDEQRSQGLSVEGTDNKEFDRPNGVDSDAQAMVISSLRSQIQDLFSQVTQLNGKLVQSYDRVSNLEDDLHIASSNLRSSSVKISQLELERTQHLSALNTGLLVEKSQVTAELTRLMEKATEEAAQRGQAESARADIEKDLDDLSASLFGQANTMVAEARFARSISERKVVAAELALKGAEEAVGLMQVQMQSMQVEKELAEKNAQEMQALLGKGKWVDRSNGDIIIPSLRLLNSHAPYQEFLLFIAHLRSTHASSPSPPQISTLLPLPFLARLLSEDSESTVRLDLAPSLNWLSRRSVLSAIHNGQLTIEPVSAMTLLHESASYLTTGLNSTNNNICCALCGTPIFLTPESLNNSHIRPSTNPLASLSMSRSNTSNSSWSASLFKNPLSYSNADSANNSPPPTPSARHSTHPVLNNDFPLQPAQIHIFRLSPPNSSSLPVSLPMTPSSSAYSSHSTQVPAVYKSQSYVLPQSQGQPRQSTIYPLCPSGWCLNRLRTTCSLWAFIRTGIVEKVWEEDIPPILPPPERGSSVVPPKSTPVTNATPPVPPRRRGLWGMANVLGEKAASWTEGDKTKDKEREAEAEREGEKEQAKPATRRMPPPLPRTTAIATSNAGPPPLPKRNEGRGSNRANSSPAATERNPLPIDHTEDPSVGTDQVNDIHATPPSASDPTVLPVSSIPNDEYSRSRSPTSVPLPESRAATPAPAASVIPHSMVHHPVRTASPGPTPPPLPRRAAARTRPMSTILPDDVGSRPNTPSPHPAVALAVFPEETAHQETSPTPAQETLVGPREAVLNGQPRSDVDPAPIEAPSISEDIQDEHKSENVANETSQLTPAQPNQTTPPTTSLAKHNVNSQEEASAGGNGKVQDNDVPPVDEKTNVSNEDSTPSNVNIAKMKEEEGKGMYIGDTTWEERTWKELVKLREDMFWARIGGLK